MSLRSSLPCGKTALAAALLAAFCVPHAAAQDATLGAVVVTASGFEQQLKDAPASITIVTGEELRQRSFRDLPTRCATWRAWPSPAPPTRARSRSAACPATTR